MKNYIGHSTLIVSKNNNHTLGIWNGLSSTGRKPSIPPHNIPLHSPNPREEKPLRFGQIVGQAVHKLICSIPLILKY